jgi:hypothetical protein
MAVAGRPVPVEEVILDSGHERLLENSHKWIPPRDAGHVNMASSNAKSFFTPLFADHTVVRMYCRSHFRVQAITAFNNCFPNVDSLR